MATLDKTLEEAKKIIAFVLNLNAGKSFMNYFLIKKEKAMVESLLFHLY